MRICEIDGMKSGGMRSRTFASVDAALYATMMIPIRGASPTGRARYPGHGGPETSRAYHSRRERVTTEGGHPLRRAGHSSPRGDRVPAEADGGDRRPSGALAHHEALRAPRPHRLRDLHRVPGPDDQGLLPQLRGVEQRL